MLRRTLFGALPALLLDCSRPSPEAAEVEAHAIGAEPPPMPSAAVEIDPREMLFGPFIPSGGIGPGMVRGVDPVKRAMRHVPRWELLDAQDQPEPLEAELRGDTSLFRFWKPEDVPQCSLCCGCNATEAAERPGQMVCLVEIPQGTPRELALWSQRPPEA